MIGDDCHLKFRMTVNMNRHVKRWGWGAVLRRRVIGLKASAVGFVVFGRVMRDLSFENRSHTMVQCQCLAGFELKHDPKPEG